MWRRRRAARFRGGRRWRSTGCAERARESEETAAVLRARGPDRRRAGGDRTVKGTPCLAISAGGARASASQQDGPRTQPDRWMNRNGPQSLTPVAALAVPRGSIAAEFAARLWGSAVAILASGIPPSRRKTRRTAPRRSGLLRAGKTPTGWFALLLLVSPDRLVDRGTGLGGPVVVGTARDSVHRVERRRLGPGRLVASCDIASNVAGGWLDRVHQWFGARDRVAADCVRGRFTGPDKSQSGGAQAWDHGV